MIHIVDYNAGNLTSVQRALTWCGIQSEITQDADAIRNAERIIFPGVGHAQSAVAALREHNLDTALREAYDRGTPILGICLGTQIILSHSDEADTTCLGLITGNCIRFKLTDPSLKVPHMGWNELVLNKHHFVLKDIREGDEFYFVHSYYPSPVDPDKIIGRCEYEMMFPAVIGQKNLIATQFHPEKSGEPGLAILKNFAEWDGTPC